MLARVPVLLLALITALPFTVSNHSGGLHGFEKIDDGEALLGDRQFAQACAELGKLRGRGLGPRDLGLPAARACMQNGDADAAIAWLSSIPKRFLPARTKDEEVFSPAPAREGQGEGVSVTFLANEGVLLSTGTRKVLIDALFLKYETGYAVPPDSTRAALERARAPFDAVDLVLVTHRHGDHFHPAPVAAHLAANPRAVLLTSAQVVDSMRHHLSPAALAGRQVMARTTLPGARHRETVNGILVELLGLPHGGGRRHEHVEHLGYVVELGGRRVLHVGDTDISEHTFARMRLDTSRIDVALLPVWMVTSEEGRAVIDRWIRPRQVVAFHVGEGAVTGERTAREVQAARPGTVTFARPLERREW